MIKGYKGMDAHMRCRGMQYEIGKSYHVDGEIGVCVNGLHFCKRLNDVFYYYKRDGGNRFFEVEASGTVKEDGNKSVASNLAIVREIDDIEVNRTIYGSGYGDGTGEGGNCGDGYGNGSGNGMGDGGNCGDGYGYGSGYGDGTGDGGNCGDGYGNGNGNGTGNGCIDGYGDGDVYGDVYSIQKILLFA